LAFEAKEMETTPANKGDDVEVVPGSAPEEGVSAIRFTPDGARITTTGYLPYLDGAGLWRKKG
jgi:hypothetical protein